MRHPATQGRRSPARVMALASVAIALVAVGAIVASHSFQTPPTAPTATVVRGASAVVDVRASEGARRVRSAVVQIRVQSESGTRSATGLVVDSSGHVLTTSDALRDATSIDVIPVQGDARPAVVTGLDPADDIAVLSTDPSGLSPAALVDAEDIASDPSIFVIGLTTDMEPIWLRTGRLVAAHVRVDDPGGQTLHDMLQATVSGDPPAAAIVCSRDGAIIGIVTDRVATTPSLRSITPPGMRSSIATATTTVYATPVTWMRSVVAQLITTGTVQRPRLGVMTLPGQRGPRVVSLGAGGPAAKGGVRVDDEIIAVADRPIDSVDALSAAVRMLRVGDQIRVTVQRGGSALTIAVTPDAAP